MLGGLVERLAQRSYSSLKPTICHPREPAADLLRFLAFGRLAGLAPGATLKTRFREGVFEPLENGPIWGAFGYFLVHWRRPGRRGRFLGFQENA